MTQLEQQQQSIETVGRSINRSAVTIAIFLLTNIIGSTWWAAKISSDINYLRIALEKTGEQVQRFNTQIIAIDSRVSKLEWQTSKK